MDIIEALFEFFWPFIIMLVIWRVGSKAKKQMANQSNEKSESKTAAGVGVNPLDVLKAMLSGDMEAIQALEEKAKGQPARTVRPEKQTRRIVKTHQGIQPLIPETAHTSHPKERVVEVPKERNAYDVAKQPSRQLGPRLDSSKGELRKAIVWSEILASPVALREE